MSDTTKDQGQPDPAIHDQHSTITAAYWTQQQDRIFALEAQVFDLQTSLKNATEQGSKPAERQSGLEAENARLRASLTDRYTELAALARMIEQGAVMPPSPRASGQAGAADRMQPAEIALPTYDDSAEQIADLKQQLDRVRKHRDDLLASTSWRVTAPIRSVVRVVRKKR